MELETALMKFKENKSKKIYLEEKNIVFGTIVDKAKYSIQVVGKRNTLGYMMPDKTIYDFVSRKVFELYEAKNLEQEGEVFLFSHRIFEKSNRKINVKSYDKEIQPIIDYHMQRHREYIEYENNFCSELKDPECIPIKKL